MPLLVKYHFSQDFPISAQEAFDWCIDFSSQDHKLMGRENAARNVERFTECTIILRDSFPLPNGTVEKQKLVQLYPERLIWTSTHLTGSNKFSQFLYVITPLGKDTSKLDFYAHHLEYNLKADLKELAKRLCSEDATAWALLAKTMKNDFRK